MAGVAALAGCADNSSSGSSGGSGDSDDTGGMTTGSAGSSSTSIEFWHIFGDTLGQTLGDMATEFSEQTDGVSIEAINNGGDPLNH